MLKVSLFALIVVAILSVIASGILGKSFLDAKHNKHMFMKSARSGINVLGGEVNPCAKKKYTNTYLPAKSMTNYDCIKELVEQSGANVTKGYQGSFKAAAGASGPITGAYFKHGMCPVNVHWHLGAEHYSAGQYDETGTGPTDIHRRRLAAGKTRKGYQCKHYDENVKQFTKKYKWQHCVGMEVGQTYEVHWPHSALGQCNTPNQYQSPFYDGVLCGIDGLTLPQVKKIMNNTIGLKSDANGKTIPDSLAKYVGVQAQVFTIVNDEDYYYPDLMRGMIVDGMFGKDVAKYTGSTAGTSRSNKMCSRYGPITWQVDRACHRISASTFDKMCADMKSQRDDMSSDLYAHGSRELVADRFAANNQQ